MEGIFRISGVSSKIAEYKKKFDKDKPVNFKEDEDIHVVCGILKLYFRELVDPLLTYSLYDSLLEAIS